METKKHCCQELKAGLGANSEFNWSLEDRGDGWYMYNASNQKSESRYNFCPCCGEKLE